MWTPRSNFEHRAEHSLFADTAMDFGEVRIQYILSFLFRFLIICHFRIVCQLNSFLMELLPMAYTLSLLVLMINRTRAIRQYVNTATKYKKIDGKIGRVKIVVTSIWLACIIVCAPVLVGVIQSWPFPARYSCHVAHEWAPIYGVVTSSFPYIMAWLGFFICSCLVYSATKVSAIQLQTIFKIFKILNSRLRRKEKR